MQSKLAQEFEAETKSRDDGLKALAQARKVISVSTSGAEAQSHDLGTCPSSSKRSPKRFERRLGELRGRAIRPKGALSDALTPAAQEL